MLRMCAPLLLYKTTPLIPYFFGEFTRWIGERRLVFCVEILADSDDIKDDAEIIGCFDGVSNAPNSATTRPIIPNTKYNSPVVNSMVCFFNSDNKKVSMYHLFFHIAAGKNWLNVVPEQLEQLKISKTPIQHLHIGFLGNSTDLQVLQNLLITVCVPHSIDFVSENLHLYEFPTLELLWNFSKQNPDAQIIYIHNKCSFFHDPKDGVCYIWRQYMMHYLFFDNVILNLLPEPYMIAGSLGVYGDNPDHFYFGGNFWAARSNYIATLSCPQPDATQDRFFAEQWVYSNITNRLQQLLTLDNTRISTTNLNSHLDTWYAQKALKKSGDEKMLSESVAVVSYISTGMILFLLLILFGVAFMLYLSHLYFYDMFTLELSKSRISQITTA